MVIGSSSLRDTVKEVRTVADLKRYQDKDGHVFSMTKEHAEKLGYTLAKDQPKTAGAADEAPAAPERGEQGESVVVNEPARATPSEGRRR